VYVQKCNAVQDVPSLLHLMHMVTTVWWYLYPSIQNLLSQSCRSMVFKTVPAIYLLTELPCFHCRKLLFSADFRRHIEAADLLLMQLPDIADAAVSCLDLLLRWAVLRLCDANTQCLLKVLDLCKALFDVCQEMVSRHGSPQACNLWFK